MESNPISFGLKLTLWFTNILTTLRMRQGIAIERQLFVNEKRRRLRRLQRQRQQRQLRRQRRQRHQ